MIPAEWEASATAAGAYLLELSIVLIPLFIGATSLVGLVQQYIPPARVERILRRDDGGSGHVIAAGIGAMTPFCSCVTIPILAGLLQARSPLGLSFSFLLASPIGTVLAFVIGGAGVSIPNLVILSKGYDRYLLAIYVGTVVSVGISMGQLFNFFLG